MPKNANNSELLKDLMIAAPCPMRWEDMAKTEDLAVRACQGCSKNVYNISAMSNQQAEELLARTGGKVCTMFFRRSDGTIITDNCPVGLRRLRDFGKRMVKIAASFAALVISCTGAIAQPSATNTPTRLGGEPLAPGWDKQKGNPAANSKTIFNGPVVPLAGAPVPMAASEKVGAADRRAFDEYNEAKAEDSKGNTLQAEAHYKQALELMKGDKHDPLMRKKISADYAALQDKMSKDQHVNALEHNSGK